MLLFTTLLQKISSQYYVFPEISSVCLLKSASLLTRVIPGGNGVVYIYISPNPVKAKALPTLGVVVVVV